MLNVTYRDVAAWGTEVDKFGMPDPYVFVRFHATTAPGGLGENHVISCTQLAGDEELPRFQIVKSSAEQAITKVSEDFAKTLRAKGLSVELGNPKS